MTCAAAASAVVLAAASLAAAAVAAAAPAAGAPGCRAVVFLDQRRKALLVGVGGVIAWCCGSSPGAFTAPSAAPSLASAHMLHVASRCNRSICLYQNIKMKRRRFHSSTLAALTSPLLVLLETETVVR